MVSWKELFRKVREETRHSIYASKPNPRQAPQRLDCVTLVTWIYELQGVALVAWPELPPSTAEMLKTGKIKLEEVMTPPLLELADSGMGIDATNRKSGDIVLARSTGRYQHHSYGTIGHVGIITDTGSVLHATWYRGFTGVREDSWEEFLIHNGPLRTIRRIIC